jgi:hypothetical protein
MSRIQIRQKIKTAALGMAIVLGILVNSERSNAFEIHSAVVVYGCFWCVATDPAPEHG